MNKQEIIKEAVDSYETHFKDTKETSGVNFHKEDVALDKEKLMKNIEVRKAESVQKHQSLEVLKDKLIIEAEDSLQKTFGKKKNQKVTKKLNTNEMYDELNEKKKHLSEMTNQLKQAQLLKMKHE